MEKVVEMEHTAPLDLKIEELDERIAPGSLIGIGPNHVHVNANHVDVL